MAVSALRSTSVPLCVCACTHLRTCAFTHVMFVYLCTHTYVHVCVGVQTRLGRRLLGGLAHSHQDCPQSLENKVCMSSILPSLFLFIYFWLCWVLVAERGLSLVAASRCHSLVADLGFLTAVASLVLEHRL